MQWFMQVLTDAGRADVAYTVASQTTRPSWGYMVSKGATTSWERWDTDTQDGGMNGESQKILSGNLEAWLYQTLAGINYDPDKPGFRHIILRPHPVGDLTFVKAEHESLYGPIKSEWKIEGDDFAWTVSIPPNTTARVHVPEATSVSVTRGVKGGDPRTVEGARSLGISDYEIQSGTYVFRAFPWVVKRDQRPMP
jgi:alpha-L-rhamnosidase